jgi:hypothetical protein
VSTAAITMPSIAFGSPGDWDRWFWRMYNEGFLEILHRACDPLGQEKWIKREQVRRRLI